MKFGVGVIGATGHVGLAYRAEIRKAKDDAMIVALCARRREPLEAAARIDGGVYATDDWKMLVQHPDVTLVVVANPDAFHYEVVMACSSARKHVFCEKPVAMNAQQAAAMWSAYRQSGLGHFVPFWIRYLPAFIEARRRVQHDELGEVKAVIYRWHNPRPGGMPFTWRDDASRSAAGSIGDVGSHAYDTIRWMLESEADRVLAHADMISPAKADMGDITLDEALRWGELPNQSVSSHARSSCTYDFADIAFVLKNGAVGSLILSHATYLRMGLAPELELHGTKASLSVDRAGGKLVLARPGKPVKLLGEWPQSNSRNRFAELVFPALRCRISGETCEHPGLEDGWRVQQFTDAAALSARCGHWVKLDGT